MSNNLEVGGLPGIFGGGGSSLLTGFKKSMAATKYVGIVPPKSPTPFGKQKELKKNF